MFGFGLGEITLIAIVAIIFLGPDKLPTALISLAKFFKLIKKTISEAQATIDREINIEEIKQEALSYKKLLEGGVDKNLAHITDESNKVIKALEEIKIDDEDNNTKDNKTAVKATKVKTKRIKDATLTGVKTTTPRKTTPPPKNKEQQSQEQKQTIKQSPNNKDNKDNKDNKENNKDKEDKKVTQKATSTTPKRNLKRKVTDKSADTKTVPPSSSPPFIP